MAAGGKDKAVGLVARLLCADAVHEVARDASAAAAAAAAGGEDEAAGLVAQLLEIVDGALAREPLQLAGQCLSRMPKGEVGGRLRGFCEGARGFAGRAPFWRTAGRGTLAQAGGALRRTLVGHSGWVMSVAMDGSRVVSGSDDKTVKVWNVETGELLHTLEGHRYGYEVTSVSLSGSLASSTDDSNTTKHWDVDAGRELEAAPPSSLAEALARRGVRVPLGHVELWTDGSLARAEPPSGLVVGARAVVWDGDQHVHFLALES